MLVYQTSPLTVEPFSCVKTFFVAINLHSNRSCEWKRFIQLFRERPSKKLCSRQSRKIIWDMINTLQFLYSSCRTYFFFFFRFPQSLAKIRPWPLVPFSQISWRNLSERNPTHNAFRDCDLHFFRLSFSKQLYIAVIVTATALSYK